MDINEAKEMLYALADGVNPVTAVFVERGNEPLRGTFSLKVINSITVDGQKVDICRWV